MEKSSQTKWILNYCQPDDTVTQSGLLFAADAIVADSSVAGAIFYEWAGVVRAPSPQQVHETHLSKV